VPRICFVQATGQNAFFGELLDALRDAVEREGWQTEAAFDHFPPARTGLIYVFVPHEFVPLTQKDAHPKAEELRRTVVLSTEQPGTTWFEEAAPFAFRAGAAVDINPLGVAELKRRGVRARRLALGYVPAWDHWGGVDDSPRPVDVTFLGGYTHRRGRALALCGRTLSRRRSVLQLVDNLQPHTSGSAHFLGGEEKWRHLATTKVLVNVHRADAEYFEWQRVVEAIANGCVVVSEHSLGFSPLVPGEHFVSASSDSLPFVVDELLEDEQRLRDIRLRAYSFLRERLVLDTTALSQTFEDLVEVPAPARPRKATGPLPRRLPARRPPWRSVIQANRAQLGRMALKRLVLGQRRLERRLERLERRSEKAAPRVTTLGPRLTRPPRVSAVITVHNYEQFVEEAARSVALSDYRDLELVVVDDGSSDRSHEVARQALENFDWLSSTLIRLPFNEGLPAARNRGARHSRGEFVFMLDADNAVYPHGVARLVAALDENPKGALAYGILECFDGTGSSDIMNWSPWSKERFAFGNYIDATALIRRSAFDHVGGFATEERLFGWEDFALWCAFAEAGFHGIHVPEIVARYRTGRISMIDVTNVDTSEAWSALLERYTFLGGTAPIYD
jgi:hypothetical protein